MRLLCELSQNICSIFPPYYYLFGAIDVIKFPIYLSVDTNVLFESDRDFLIDLGDALLI